MLPAVFLLVLLLALVLGIVAAASRTVERALLLLAVLGSAVQLADVQFGTQGALLDRGTVWGFRFTATDVLAVALVCSAGVGTLLRRRSFRWFPKITVPVAILGGVGLLSLRNAVHPLNGLFELNNLLMGWILMVGVGNAIRSEGDLRYAVGCLLAAAALPGLVGFVQHFSYLLGRPYVMRVTGTLPHSNLLAMHLNTLLPVALVLGLAARRWLAAVPLLALAVLLVASVFFTLSRGGLGALVIGFAAALLLWGIFGARERRLRMRAAVVVALLVPVAWKMTPLIAWRITSGDASASDRTRSALTEAALQLWGQHPLLGVGLNNSTIVGPLYVIHNSYALALAETGILGLAAQMTVLAAVLALALLSAWEADRGSVAKAAATGLAAGLIALYVQLYSEFALRSANIHYLFFIVAGVVAGMHALIRAARSPARAFEPHTRGASAGRSRHFGGRADEAVPRDGLGVTSRLPRRSFGPG